MRTTCTPAGRITRSMLGYGVIAGPIYVSVGLAQALTRAGFDPVRQPWSLLALGPWGWIQVANFITTGLMTVVAAVGLRRALPAGRARTWAPPLVGVYGSALVAAGLFRADPTPAAGAPVTMSWHGTAHLMAGGIGFLCLVVACLLLAARYRRENRPGLARFSWATAVAVPVGFATIASGAQVAGTLAFTAAVVTMCAWLATVSVQLYRATA